MLKPFKFTVQATALDVDDDGEPRGEAVTQPVVLYGLDALAAWVESFPAELEKAAATADGAQPA